MSALKCFCSSLVRLEGASVPAYIKAFLEQSSGDGGEKHRYHCRVCGHEWERRAPEIRSEGTRPSLVRL